MADVNADGAFSNFSGYDRCLLLLHGNGITLNTSSEQQIVLSDQLQAAEFKGDDRTVATLHDGPIKDFNVMTWRSCCHADVSSNVGQNEWSVQVVADELLIYAVENDLVILFDDHKQFCIPENHLFHVNNPVHGSVFMKGAPCIVVQIVYN